MLSWLLGTGFVLLAVSALAVEVSARRRARLTAGDLLAAATATRTGRLVMAVLWLWVNRVPPPGALDVKDVTTSWAESTVTWNTAPVPAFSSQDAGTPFRRPRNLSHNRPQGGSTCSSESWPSRP